MRITIPICTWNRDWLLDATLRRLAEAQVPEGVERTVLVVDNNSTDGTRDVARCHADRLPLEYVFVARPGKSHALNAAVDALEGDWILFIDDDVLVDVDWMTGYCRAMRRHPEASFLGGPIRPCFEASPPDWLRDVLPQVGAAFAERAFGPTPFQLDTRRLPFGANWAVRTDVQRRFPYDTNLGRRGDSLLAGEETAVLERLLEAGHEGWWVPEAAVDHVITPDRMTEIYLRQFFAGIGMTEMVRSHGGPPEGLRWYWLWTRALLAESRFQILRRIARPATWVRALSRASRKWAHVGRASGVPAFVSIPEHRYIAGRRLQNA